MATRKTDGLPTGVEFVGESIRIRFTRAGKRCCETLAFPQTPQGVQAAAGLRAQVIQLAKLGMLSDEKYAELFPSTSYVSSQLSPLFGAYAQSWLDGQEIVIGTRRNYLSILNKHWMPALARVPMDKINTALARKVSSEIAWKSPTAKRAAISLLGAVFNTAVHDDLMDRNPVKAIQLPAKSRKVIEPFSVEEADKIIEWTYANFTNNSLRIYAPYFEFAFYTGMRSGELAALRWDEIDFDKRVAYVCRIVVNRKVEERTKTRNFRLVMLNSRAIHALERAKEIAEDRRTHFHRVSTKSPFIFQPSGATGYLADASVSNTHFMNALKALGMQVRRQYNCRHTYATMCLMAGMNPAFIASQLGHSVQMLLSTYARWLSSSTDWNELGRLEKSINGTKVVLEIPKTL